MIKHKTSEKDVYPQLVLRLQEIDVYFELNRFYEESLMSFSSSHFGSRKLKQRDSVLS